MILFADFQISNFYDYVSFSFILHGYELDNERIGVI
jgi:hypothetical protein